MHKCPRCKKTFELEPKPQGVFIKRDLATEEIVNVMHWCPLTGSMVTCHEDQSCNGGETDACGLEGW